MSNRPALPWSDGQTYVEFGVRYVYRSAIQKWRIDALGLTEPQIDAARVSFSPSVPAGIAASTVQDAIVEAATEAAAALSTHAARVDNPHVVTKAQVGLGNVPNVDASARSAHTGTQLSSTISDFTATASAAAPVQSVAGRIGAVSLAKTDVGLENVDNTSDANKPISTAVQTALDGKQATLGYTAENVANKGQVNGYAGLDNAGKVPSAQLPSYVDDVIEAANLAGFPGTGEAGKIYVALDTGKIYRWSGSAYVEISPSPGSTDSVPEGSTNLYHTTARASAAAPVQSVAGRTGAVTLAKGDVGLSNVDNTADASKSFTASQISNSTTVGRNVLTAADQAAARSAIGVGAGTGDLVAANNLSELTATAATARTNLGVPPNTRSISAAGLATGGGDLSTDRTITVTKSSQAQALAGSDDTTAMTPLRTKEAIYGLGFGRCNRIVNGAMMISQENGTTAGTANGFYPVDQFSYIASHDGTISLAQVASVTPGGSPNRLRATVTATDTSIASGQYAAILTWIEGLQIADCLFGTASAKRLMLRFGMKAPAGTYCVSITNNARNRSFIADVVISAGEANTDVVKTVSVAGDTSGTWPMTNIGSLQVRWSLAAGSAYSGAVGWNAGDVLRSANQSNFLGTNSQVFELFDVGLYVDADNSQVVPPWELPAYEDELRRCQRYWYTTKNAAGNSNSVWIYGYNVATATPAMTIWFPTTMRSAPIGAVTGTWIGSNASGLNLTHLDENAVVVNAYVVSTGAFLLYGGNVGCAVIANARM